MESLLKIAKVDHNKLKQFLMRTTSFELSELSKPCYYPRLKKNYFNLLNLTHLTDKQLKEFAKRFYTKTKFFSKTEQLLNLQKDPITNLLIFIMYYFLKNNDMNGYSTTMLYFGIRNYANILNKQIRYCSSEAFKYALENVAKTHLFSREQTIGNALYFMSKEIMRKYTNDIKNGDPDNMGLMINEFRHRISQSVKSFAEIYYNAQESQTGIRNPKEYEDEESGAKFEEQTQEKYQRVVDNISYKVCVYRHLDKRALNDAKNVTKINLNLATSLANSISNTKYIENVKLILKLFIKDIKQVKTLCNMKEYFKYIREMMSIKRTSSVIYFKQQISELTEKLIIDINYADKYSGLSSQSKYMINLFVGLYITMILKNTLCG